MHKAPLTTSCGTTASSESKDNAAIQPLKDTIAGQEKEIESLRKKLEETEARSKQEVGRVLMRVWLRILTNVT